jgi:hypothetical protein
MSSAKALDSLDLRVSPWSDQVHCPMIPVRTLKDDLTELV